MTKYPNKCIKCKKEDTPLNDFIHARSFLAGRFKTVYYKIPICNDCKNDLLKYEKRLRILKSKNYLFCIFCISGLIIYQWILSNSRISPTLVIFTIVIAIISGVLLLLLSILHIIFYLKKYDRISNYIKIKKNGLILIEDPEYRIEFEELSLSELSKEDELYNCPNCKTLVLLDMEFCHVCGRDLGGSNKK